MWRDFSTFGTGLEESDSVLGTQVGEDLNPPLGGLDRRPSDRKTHRAEEGSLTRRPRQQVRNRCVDISDSWGRGIGPVYVFDPRPGPGVQDGRVDDRSLRGTLGATGRDGRGPSRWQGSEVGPRVWLLLGRGSLVDGPSVSFPWVRRVRSDGPLAVCVVCTGGSCRAGSPRGAGGRTGRPGLSGSQWTVSGSVGLGPSSTVGVEVQERTPGQ